MNQPEITRTMAVEDWMLSFWSSDEEPRLRDVELGERLGYDRPRDIRKLIERRKNDVEFGEVNCRATVARQPVGPGGTGEREYTVHEYYLTEAQALEISALSETTNGKAILRTLIRVFLLARRGMLPNQGNGQWAFSATYVENVFEGQAITAYLWEDKPVWIAKELGRVMGYSEEGRGLVETFRKDWKEELIEGTDFEVLEGERLSTFKTSLPNLSTFTPLVDFFRALSPVEKPPGKFYRPG